MSARNPKRDALLQTLLENKPRGGEDFFALTIITDAAEPTWDERQTFVGGYEQAAALAVAALGIMADNGGLKKGARLEMYQGENARGYLSECSIQEASYQRERKEVKNN